MLHLLWPAPTCSLQAFWESKEEADQSTLPAFMQELRHDAEFSAWIFLWWIVLAARGERVCLHWSSHVDVFPFGRSYEHRSGYAVLYAPIQVIPIRFCVSWISSTPATGCIHNKIDLKGLSLDEERYKHPEHLHGALQRVILNSVLGNKDGSSKTSWIHRFSWQCHQYMLSILPLPSSSRLRKRKTTNSSVHDMELLSGVSSNYRSGYGSLTVRFIAQNLSFTMLSLFFRYPRKTQRYWRW